MSISPHRVRCPTPRGDVVDATVVERIPRATTAGHDPILVVEHAAGRQRVLERDALPLED